MINTILARTCLFVLFFIHEIYAVIRVVFSEGNEAKRRVYIPRLRTG